MPEHNSISAILKDKVTPGSQVTVKGWLRSKRDSKAGISFLAVHDGSAFDALQAVVPDSLDNYQSQVLHLSTGCAVIVSGELVQSEGKGQSLEIQATAVEVVGGVDDPESYPIAKKRHTFEYLRTQAHLRPRTNTFGAITRVRTTLANAIHNYCYGNGFHWINTPIITGSDCEGAGELFRVSTLDQANLPRDGQGGVDYEQDFFSGESFLTVSGQLEVEAYCLAMSKVYTPGHGKLKTLTTIAQDINGLRIIHAFEIIIDHASQALDHVLVNTLLEKRNVILPLFEHRRNHVLEQAFSKIRVVVKVSKGYFRLHNPEFGQMATGIGIFGPKGWPKGVDLTHGQAISLDFQLP